MTIAPPTLVLVAAVAIDLVLGEPSNRWHPVAWMGGLIAVGRRLAPAGGARRQLAYGAAHTCAVLAVVGTAAMAVASLRAHLPEVGIVLEVLLLKSAFSLSGLRDASLPVRDALSTGDLAGARTGLAALCSRDPAALGASELAGATVSSIAENASDSFVAPVLYYVLFGLPGALLYRAVNTLDAMIGYHGETEYLGKCAARLDDAVNLVPARLTALGFLAVGLLGGRDVGRAMSVVRRGRGVTASPNAGWPMAAMAGLLGVTLEKRGHYRITGGDVAADAGTIDDAWDLVRVLAALIVLGAVMMLGARHG